MPSTEPEVGGSVPGLRSCPTQAKTKSRWLTQQSHPDAPPYAF